MVGVLVAFFLGFLEVLLLLMATCYSLSHRQKGEAKRKEKLREKRKGRTAHPKTNKKQTTITRQIKLMIRVNGHWSHFLIARGKKTKTKRNIRNWRREEGLHVNYEQKVKFHDITLQYSWRRES